MSAVKILLAIALGLTDPRFMSAAQPGMAAYIKDGQAYIARDGASQTLRISPGESTKSMPKWSPDGKRVVYLDPSAERDRVGSLVVVDTRGAVLGRYPISTRAADGARIEGMRFVERIGWMDNSHIFAEGSVNPHAGEYRTIDIVSGKIGGFIGTGFATCANSGLVAYWLPVFPPSTAMQLQLSSGNAPVFTFPDWNALPTIFVELAWDRQCTTLAFVDPRPPARLMLAIGDSVHTAVPLPDPHAAPIVSSTSGGFLIGSGGKFFYDLATSRIVPTPTEIRQAAQSRDTVRKRMLDDPGVTDIDYRDGPQ